MENKAVRFEEVTSGQKLQVSILAETYPSGHLICDIYKRRNVKRNKQSDGKNLIFINIFHRENAHSNLKFF